MYENTKNAACQCLIGRGNAVCHDARGGVCRGAELPELGTGEFDYHGLRYKKLNDTDVAVVGPVEVQTERVIPETVINNGTTYTVTEIGPYAFSRDTTKSQYTAFVGYPDFKSVTIPNTVTVLRTSAFSGGADFNDYDTDKGLQSVTFSPGSQLKTIEKGAFAGSYTLRGEFVLPNTVESIGDDAFDGCQFKKFTFQEGSQLKSIGAHAFHWLGKVESFSLPEGVTTISDYAFWACTSLTEFVVPDGVQTIGSKAFGHCYDLQTITIPSSVKNIANDIFEGDTKITTIYYDGTESDWLKLSNGNSTLENLTVYYANNVNFDLNGCGETAPETQKIYNNGVAVKPADPTAKGYKFVGWYADEDCTTAFDFTKPVTENTTLYAKWEAIPDHQLTVTGGTFTVKDETVEPKTEGDKLIANVPEGAEVTVTFNKDADSNLTFDGWKIEGLADAEKYTGETFTFTMPKNGVTIKAQTKAKAAAPAEDDSLDAATVVTGVVLGTGTAILAYHIGTELYAEQVLGEGVAVPKTREDVALKAWELAGKPAVELNGEPLSVAAQAEKWAVESGLMQNDANGSFNGAKKMNKLKALRVLDNAKNMNA